MLLLLLVLNLTSFLAGFLLHTGAGALESHGNISPFHKSLLHVTVTTCSAKNAVSEKIHENT